MKFDNTNHNEFFISDNTVFACRTTFNLDTYI